MPSVKYHVLNNSIVLNYLSKTITVAANDSRYNDVLEAIRTERLDDIPAIVEVERAFEGSGLELRDGLLYTDGQPIPTELNSRILKYKDLGLPYASLLKFWENLKQNPSYNSRQQLFAFLSHNGHPLTDDGCFIAYRGVTEDFKDKHTRKFDNSPGAVCEMDRQLVDDNPNNTCSRGLHVACFEYAKGFGERLVEVKVNPKDVVCVPTDYQGTKMRTCRFEVVAECKDMRTETVYNTPDPVEHDTRLGSFDHEDEDEELDDNVCTECNHENTDFANYCEHCGEDLSE